jgi:hypothetical protein
MLRIWGRKPYSLCDGISRRSFLIAGALGMGGLSLADLLRLRAQGAQDPKSTHKAVIMVYLEGGPSHLDLYDMKPDAPVEIRGGFKPIRTNVPGLDICELMPQQAKVADKLAIVRGIRFAGQHAANELLSGVGILDRKRRPALGCVVSKLEGRRPLPPYVSLADKLFGDDPESPAYLGAAYRPFKPGGSGLDTLALPAGLDLERVGDRKEVLRSLDTLRREMDDRSGTLAGADRFTSQALEMISSPRAREALDITREPPEVRAKYGKTTDFLLARRLVEAGVSVVLLKYGAWDNHGDIINRHHRSVPELDQALYALITDLHERGLDKDVAVVAWGEFGRAPRMTLNPGTPSAPPGRDHWPPAGFALLAGGGLKTGQVVGETDARGERAKDRPFKPSNVLATLYHVLGIDPATTFPDHNGRPTYLLDDREAIPALL